MTTSAAASARVPIKLEKGVQSGGEYLPVPESSDNGSKTLEEHTLLTVETGPASASAELRRGCVVEAWRSVGADGASTASSTEPAVELDEADLDTAELKTVAAAVDDFAVPRVEYTNDATQQRPCVHNSNVLHHTSAELREDREVVLAAVGQNGNALKHASAELQGDQEFVLAAVVQNGTALKHASAELQGDREVVQTCWVSELLRI